MTILTLPASPGIAASRFGLTSNTTLFRNPLTGQTQTLERPGARWQAFYKLPPMKRVDAVKWQTFLLQLRGGAGRFYGFDPDAKNPRGTALPGIASSRNEIRNGDAVGAIAGGVGSGGYAPTFWAFGTPNGITRTVVGSGVESGVSYVEVRFQGTPTGTFTTLMFDGATQIAVNEAETWTGSFSYKMTAGSLTNIGGPYIRFEQTSSTGAVQQTHFTALSPVDATWRRVVQTKVMSDTMPDTKFLRPAFQLSLTIGQAIDITVRIGNAQFEKKSSASAYIPTHDGARSLDAGARVNGADQSGSTLLTWNWQSSQAAVLKAGDYVAFETEAGRSLHMVMADAASDVDGKATLLIEPPLRAPPLDNAGIIVSSAGAVMALDEDSVAWEADEAGTYKLSFSAEERF